MSQELENVPIKVSILTIKDIVTLVSVAVMITISWGVFGTRLSLTEQELIYQQKRSTEIAAIDEKEMRELKERITRLEQRVRDHELLVENLWARKGISQRNENYTK